MTVVVEFDNDTGAILRVASSASGTPDIEDAEFVLDVPNPARWWYAFESQSDPIGYIVTGCEMTEDRTDIKLKGS